MKALFTAIIILVTLYPATSKASPQISLLMDAETLAWLEDISAPLIKTANLQNTEIDFYLIKSNAINAFVTPENNIYINSGLILRAENQAEVQAVIAHELGHIKAQHLTKASYHTKNFSIPAIIGGILGVGAMAAGSDQVGTALIVSGQAAMRSNILKFTRMHERQADRIAANLLNNSNLSTKPMLTFFEKLRGDQLLYSRVPPPYLVTHPLPTERVDSIRNHFINENKELVIYTANNKFAKIQAKLFAFSHSRGATLRKYNNKNNDVGIYVQAIVKAMQGHTQKSLDIVDNLLKKEDKNPFLYELRGQITLDNGDITTAGKYFAKALKLQESSSNKSSPLLRLQLAQNLIAENRETQAIPHLLRLTTELEKWQNVRRLLGIAYGKLGKLGLSHLYLAEEAIMKNDKKSAKMHLNTAEEKLANNIKMLNKIKLLREKLDE